MSNPTEQKHQRVQDLYRALRSENFDRPQYKYSLELIKLAALQPGRVIEFGGGRAEFSRLLRDRGFQVVFTDINEANVEHARSIGFEAFVSNANELLDRSWTGQFDGAVMLEVIEHVTNAELLLKETCRILKPGGFLLLSTPNPYFLWRRLAVLFGRPIDGEGYHYRYFTRKTLEDTLKDHGFVVAFRHHYTSALGLGGFLQRLGTHETLRFPRFMEGLVVRKFYYLLIKR